MENTKVDEDAARAWHPPSRDGSAGEYFVDPTFRPVLTSHDGYSESASEPVVPEERKKKRAENIGRTNEK